MKLRGLISVILSVAMVAAIAPQPVQVAAAAKVYNIDTSDIDATAPNITMTDKEFFDKINLSYMPDVQKAVNAGNYASAKKELLKYYQNKFADNMPAFYSGIQEWMNYMALNDAYSFTEPRLGGTTIIGNTDAKFHDYYIDIGKNTAGGVYVLSSLSKSEAAVDIVSREHASAETLAPKLIFYKNGAEVKTLSSVKDTYIRNGSYANDNFGQNSYFHVKCDSSNDLPYTAQSRIGYVCFDVSRMPATNTYDNIKLKIHARSQLDDIKIEVFDAYNKSWAEYEGDGSGFLPMTWNNYKVAHYSWSSVDGGFDWKKPANVASEWFNYNTRFYEQTSLMRTADAKKFSATEKDKDGYTYAEYAHKSLAIMQDFANDAYGRIAANTGVPERRDIESANRCIEFPALYARYVKFLDSSSDHDAQLNVNMLKWLFQELTYLYNGAGIIYNGATVDVKNTEIAYNNRGVWHVYGFLSSAFGFNEFKNYDAWKALATARLEDNMSKLMLPDGAYGEAVFGYQPMVINYWVSLAQLYIEKGIAYPDNYINKIAKVIKYLMDCTQPNGETPTWGHNSSKNRSNIINWVKTGIFTIENGVDANVIDALQNYVATENPGYNDVQYDDIRVAVARTGWTGNDSMLFMNAKNGRSHSHKDSLAFTWYHNGAELLTDTGMTSYDSGHPHFNFQQNTTRSHNTVEVDGVGQRNANQPQNDGNSNINMVSNDSGAFISGYTDANRHSGGAQVDHYRNVTYLKDRDMVIVHDKMAGLDSASHTYTQNWHTQSINENAVTANNTAKQAYTSYSNGKNIIVAQPASDNSTVSVSKDGLDRRFSTPTHFMTFTKTGKGNVNYRTVIKSVDGGDKVSVSVNDKGCDANNSKLEIVLTENGVTDTYTHFSSFDSSASRTFCGYETDGKSATLSTDAIGNLDYVSIFGGSRLTSASKTYVKAVGATNISVQKLGNVLKIYTDPDYKDIITLSGFGTGISDVLVNDVDTSITVNGEVITAYPGVAEWKYYPDKNLLHIYGGGDLTSVDFSAYTDVETLWIGPDIKIASGTKLSSLTKLDKIYMDAKYFDVSWTSCTTDATYKSTGYINGNEELPDTWAVRNQTIKSGYDLSVVDTVKYIPASATDTPAYNPQENTSTWTYTCPVPNSSYDWYLDVLTGKLTIKDGNMAGGNVRDGRFWPWHDACDIITSIYMDDSITAMGKNSFSSLDKVEDVRLSAAINTLNMYAFDGNTALKKILIPGNVDVIAPRAIRKCSALTEVIICNGVTTISDNSFDGSSNIKNIVLPDDIKIGTNPGIPNSAVRYSYDTLPASGVVNGQTSLVWSYDNDSDTLKFKGDGVIPSFGDSAVSDAQWQAHITNTANVVLDGDIAVKEDAFRESRNISTVY